MLPVSRIKIVGAGLVLLLALLFAASAAAAGTGLANRRGHRMTMTLKVSYTAAGTTQTILQHQATITAEH